MTVRFFGGFDFEAADARNRIPAAVGYRKGVPMGGDLSQAPAGKAPTFLVAALKDAIGANLDRIQVVKGWLDKAGEVQEKVYDVSARPAPARCRNGQAAAGREHGGRGQRDLHQHDREPELITVWKDPDFDPSLRAFYYARVLEIPTPRWTAYDAKYFGVKMPPEAPMVQQERAYTSPIWYTP